MEEDCESDDKRWRWEHAAKKIRVRARRKNETITRIIKKKSQSDRHIRVPGPLPLAGNQIHFSRENGFWIYPVKVFRLSNICVEGANLNCLRKKRIRWRRIAKSNRMPQTHHHGEGKQHRYLSISHQDGKRKQHRYLPISQRRRGSSTRSASFKRKNVLMVSYANHYYRGNGYLTPVWIDFSFVFSPIHTPSLFHLLILFSFCSPTPVSPSHQVSLQMHTTSFQFLFLLN